MGRAMKPRSTRKIGVLLVDDHQIFLDGLRQLFNTQADMEVVAEVLDGRRAVELSRELNPDVVVMDIAMPGLNGIETIARIMALRPSPHTIVLSMHSSPGFVARALAAGARGYVLKECAFAELHKAIRAVMAGETFFSARITKIVFEDYVQRLVTGGTPSGALLTSREREIVQLVTEGRRTKEIADALHICSKTVESHRHQIIKKLGLRNLPELVKYAIQEGMTSLERL